MTMWVNSTTRRPLSGCGMVEAGALDSAFMASDSFIKVHIMPAPPAPDRTLAGPMGKRWTAFSGVHAADRVGTPGRTDGSALTLSLQKVAEVLAQLVRHAIRCQPSTGGHFLRCGPGCPGRRKIPSSRY
ncbi:hypothetical protein D9M68_835780 [compost metagenome]